MNKLKDGWTNSFKNKKKLYCNVIWRSTQAKQEHERDVHDECEKHEGHKLYTKYKDLYL